MTTDLEQQLRDHYVSVADELDLPPLSFDALLDHGATASALSAQPRHSDRRPGRTWLMVAAIVALIAAGVVVLSARRTKSDLTGSERSTTVATPPRALSDVDELGPSNWVIATVLPDDVAWLYPLAFDPTTTGPHNWASVYGTRLLNGGGERLHITVGNDAPSLEFAERFEIDGTTWMVNVGPDHWQAVRNLGSVNVFVRDSGIFGDSSLELIAGLAVVTDSKLPSPPLGRRNEAVDVARFDLDGGLYTLSVQESNGFWCVWASSTDGLSGACGGVIDRSAAITVEEGSNIVADGASTSEMMRAGSVAQDVARVEVEFPDGTVISVTPTDFSGQFDRKFWIAAAIISRESVAVGEVRAYDDAGRLLATEQLSQPG